MPVPEHRTSTAETNVHIDLEAGAGTSAPVDSSPPVDRHDTLLVKPSEQESSDEPLKTSTPTGGRNRDDKLRLATWGLVAVAVVAYSITAFVKDFQRAKPLLYFEIGGLMLAACVLLSRTSAIRKISAKVISAASAAADRIASDKKLTALAAIITLALVGVVIGLSVQDARRLISLFGLGVFIVGSWLCSWNRPAVKWRPVIGGLLFQLLFGFLILRTEAGYRTFDFLGKKMNQLIGHTDAGANFVFGWAAQGFNAFEFDANNQSNTAKVVPYFGAFAFKILPTVIFFSALVSILYYLGFLQAFIRVIGAVLCLLLGTSVSESLNAAGNIFVGQTEAPLLIRPFLAQMTPSELHAVMTGGFATIAGGVLAVYINFGVDASHLLAASVMSAPAALAISKLLYPEDETSKTAAGVEYEIPNGEDGNLIEAAANGAAMAIKLAINIGGQLIAFIAIIDMLNSWLASIGALVDVPQLSFELICGYVLYPIAFIMGVPAKDCLKVGTLLGQKIFVNEFVAYDQMSKQSLDPRSETIATFALCGFANFSSIGVQLGGLVPIAPNQSKQLARLVFSAMIAGNIACFMTACVAGVLVKESK